MKGERPNAERRKTKAGRRKVKEASSNQGREEKRANKRWRQFLFVIFVKIDFSSYFGLDCYVHILYYGTGVVDGQ